MCWKGAAGTIASYEATLKPNRRGDFSDFPLAVTANVHTESKASAIPESRYQSFLLLIFTILAAFLRDALKRLPDVERSLSDLGGGAERRGVEMIPARTAFFAGRRKTYAMSRTHRNRICTTGPSNLANPHTCGVEYPSSVDTDPAPPKNDGQLFVNTIHMMRWPNMP